MTPRSAQDQSSLADDSEREMVIKSLTLAATLTLLLFGFAVVLGSGWRPIRARPKAKDWKQSNAGQITDGPITEVGELDRQCTRFPVAVLLPVQTSAQPASLQQPNGQITDGLMTEGDDDGRSRRPPAAVRPVQTRAQPVALAFRIWLAEATVTATQEWLQRHAQNYWHQRANAMVWEAWRHLTALSKVQRALTMQALVHIKGAALSNWQRSRTERARGQFRQKRLASRAWSRWAHGLMQAWSRWAHTRRESSLGIERLILQAVNSAGRARAAAALERWRAVWAHESDLFALLRAREVTTSAVPANQLHSPGLSSVVDYDRDLRVIRAERHAWERQISSIGNEFLASLAELQGTTSERALSTMRCERELSLGRDNLMGDLLRSRVLLESRAGTFTTRSLGSQGSPRLGVSLATTTHDQRAWRSRHLGMGTRQTRLQLGRN